MKIMMMGDIHSGKSLNEDLLEMQLEVFEWSINLAKKEKVNAIIQSGDFFDKRQSVDFKALHNWKPSIEKLRKSKIPFIYVAGNHCFYHKNENDINSFRLLFEPNKNWTYVIDEPVEFKEFNLLVVPWMNKNTEQKDLKTIAKSKMKYCLGHFPINGFQLVKGFVEKNGLDSKTFKKFKKTYSGHFHLRDETKNITYIGSLTELDWNDYKNQKGIYILDTKTGKDKFYPHKRTLFEKIIIKHEDDIDKIDAKRYNNKRIKFELFIENSITVEQKIAELQEVSSKFELIDKYTIIKNMDVDIEFAKKEEVSDIFNEYIGNLTLSKTENKGVTKIFSELYKESIDTISEA